MTGFTDLAAYAALNALVSAYPHVGLFTVLGTDAGTGFAEVVAGSYLRFDSGGKWNAATGTNPAHVTNSADFIFGPADIDWGTIVGFGLFNAPLGGGALGASDYLGPGNWLPCTISSASPGIITTDRLHGMTVGDRAVYSNELGGTVPTFSQSNLIGPLIVASAASVTLTVKNTGLPVNTNSVGSGQIRTVIAQPINPITSTLTFNAGTFKITLA